MGVDKIVVFYLRKKFGEERFKSLEETFHVNPD
jgi:hypothetical protein